jgi:hypothetical protein
MFSIVWIWVFTGDPPLKINRLQEKVCPFHSTWRKNRSSKSRQTSNYWCILSNKRFQKNILKMERGFRSYFDFTWPFIKILITHIWFNYFSQVPFLQKDKYHTEEPQGASQKYLNQISAISLYGSYIEGESYIEGHRDGGFLQHEVTASQWSTLVILVREVVCRNKKGWSPGWLGAWGWGQVGGSVSGVPVVRTPQLVIFFGLVFS